MFETKQIAYQDITEFPEPIYKYRRWDDPNHKEILTHRNVFMARPSSFLDPLDCRLEKRYDLLTDPQIYDHFYKDSRVTYPHRTRQQHRSFARTWSKITPIRNHAWVKGQQARDFNYFDSRFGVLSMTANCMNNAMWNRYSDSHRGFCVGFNSKRMFRFIGGAGIVKYYDILPDILPTDPFEMEYWKKIYSKEEKWNFEEEYRTSYFYTPDKYAFPPTDNQRKIKLPQDCYREVIFGAEMPTGDRNEIIDACKGAGLSVDFLEAKRDKDTNMVTVEPIS